MKAKNVLHIVEYLYLGGIERLLEQLACKTGSKANLHFFTYETETLDGIGKQIVNKGIPVYTYKKKAGRDFKLLGELIRVIKEKKIDVIHTHDFGPTEYAVMLKIRFPHIKLVHTQHTIFEFIKNWKYTLFLQGASYFYHRMISVSNYVNDTLLDHCSLMNRSSLVVIPNGVDTELYSPSVIPSEQQSLKLVSISRISHEKNLDFLFNTCRLLKEKNIPFTFHHAGTSTNQEEVNRFKKYIEDNQLEEEIVMHGFTENAKKVLDMGDIFLTSSLTEGHPIASLEAMACEKICFCSDIPAHRELGTGAISLFDISDENSLANILENYYRTSPEFSEKRRLAREIVIEKFSITKMIDNYVNLY